MQKRKRKALQALNQSQVHCEMKFNVLQSVYTEYGTNSLRRVRDKMNHAGTHFQKHTTGFSTHVKGSNKKPNSGSMPPRGL